FRNQAGRVSGAARLLDRLDRGAVDAIHGRDDFANAVAVPVSAVQCGRGAALAQVVERLDVGVREILNVDVIAYSGSVGCFVVRAEDRQVRALADRDLAGDLRQQCSVDRRLTDTPSGIATRDVEVAQHDIAQGARG